MIIDYDGDELDIRELIPDVTNEEKNEFWFLQNTDLGFLIDRNESIENLMQDIKIYYREIFYILFRDNLFHYVTKEHFAEYLRKRYKWRAKKYKLNKEGDN